MRFILALCTLVLATCELVPPVCSANGVLGPNGCDCVPGWGGLNCSTLQLLPSAPLSIASQPYLHPWSDDSWGISILPGDGDGLYHAFITEMEGNCSILVYPYVSRILHGVSASITGPFNVTGVALDVFAHNVQVLRDPSDAGWLLFHIGTSRAAAAPGCSMTCIDDVPLMNLTSQCWTEYGMWASVAKAASPYGPWTRVNDIFPDGAQNPSAIVAQDGSVLATSRGGGGVNLYTAPTWSGPYTQLSAPAVLPDPLFPDQSLPGMFEEDPFLWRNEYGYHILTHRQLHGADCSAAPASDDCTCRGGHLYAAADDVTTWWRGASVYNCTLSMQDGSSVVLKARQRPSLTYLPDGCPVLLNGGSTALVSQYLSSFSMAQHVNCT